MRYLPLILVVICSFVTVHTCPSLCTCIADTISCNNRGLTIVPSFSSADMSGVRVLDLSHNNFTSLPVNAFPNSHFETLKLDHNRLRTLPNGTFQGVASDIKNIDLSNNELLTLPDALAALDHLISLNVSNNYRGSSDINLPNNVMRALGDTLEEFTFGSIKQTDWPRTLNHFQNLHRLEITSLHPNLIILPPTGFHGFETTLVELSIHDTNLLTVPIGISKLRNLLTLNYDNNRNTGDSGILLQSFPTSSNSKLSTLSLKGDSLTIFPLVLKYLQKLTKFSIDNNPLDFLSETSVEGLHTLRELTIRNCSLERIPAALATIAALGSIDFSFNAIETVEKRDLQGFTNIQKLTLSNMPLKYISRDSLAPLHSLQVLELNNTALTEVPLAINFTDNLKNVSIGHNRIDCMCENMVWLFHKAVECNPTGVHGFQVIGECDTIHATVEEYLTNFVQRCPGYKEICNIMPYG
ncbi:uncharacterized protein LOC143066927 [Mytilus galloprovincialis]|uniref:uncharacterized protein LOC143066927 n=1 Tax=Mytilus galloprovincialis TaxID=29158 RepID=UPI003F7B7A13